MAVFAEENKDENVSETFDLGNLKSEEETLKTEEKSKQEERENPDTQEENQAETPPAGSAASEIEKLNAALVEKDSRFLRLQADFENFRRRTRQEKEELAAVVTQSLLKDMLPLLDNFERALQSESSAEGFRTGVEMIYKQFGEALAKNGLEYIDTKDQKFDPNFHQAVMREEDPEKEEGAITAELQKGYMAKGKVIRPSMVKVVGN